jgi:hypothetical protein
VHTVAFMVNVMFAVYILNFVSSFLHSFAARWGDRAVLASDLFLGVLLLIAVVLAN